MNKIKSLNHITLICQDLNKTSKLLQHLFSAEEIYNSGDRYFSLSREKFFKLADIWLVIMEGHSIEKSYNHIAFSVAEIDLPWFEQEIKMLGLTILPDRQRAPAEGKSLYFYDYDNHLFELHTGDLNSRLDFYKK